MSFQKDFLELYEPVMQGMGFARKRYVFHRLLNKQIVQKLSYVMFRGSKRFTIQYCFSPLCSGEEERVFMDDYRIGSLLGNEVLGYRDTDNPSSLQETLEICQEHLFPLFDTIVDYESYLAYVDDKNQKEFASYSEGARRRYESYFVDGIHIADKASYHINLIVGNYDTALNCREALIKTYTSRVKPHHYAKIKRNEEVMEAYQRVKAAVENEDKAYIEEYIAANEKQALDSYILNFLGKRVYDKYLLTGELPARIVQSTLT